MQLPYHPAPGLGDLLPGYFVVPQNPIQNVTVKPGIGDVLPGSFSLPQNPIRDYTTGQVRLIGTGSGVSGCGCGGGCGGCGGKGQLNGVGIAGVGDITADWAKFSTDLSSGSYMTAIQDTFFGIPAWAYAAGLALLMFAGGEQHSYYGRGRRASAAARRAFA